MRLPLSVVSLALVIAVVGTTARQANPAQLALEAARRVETIDRDLKGAVVRYRAVVSAYPKDRAVVPEALLRLAGCLEQLGGGPEALATYARLVKDYPDTAQAKAAQKKVAALGKEGSGLTITRIDGDGIGTPSPDGRYLSFTDWETGDLAVRDLKSGRTRRVTESGNLRKGRAIASVPSPDGRQIAYQWGDAGGLAQLRVISSSGGAATVLCCPDGRSVWRPFGWSMDGKQVLFALVQGPFALGGFTDGGTTQLVTVSANGGAPRVLKTVEGWVRRASWSPDGRFIIYDAPRAVGKPDYALFIMRSDGSDSAVLIPHNFNDQMLDWFPDGKHILFLSDLGGPNAVFAQGIADGKAVGGAFLVKDSLGGNSSSIEGLGFTRDGSYHYRTRTYRQDVLTFRLDASGAVSQELARLPGPFANGKQGAAWSPDGTEIAYVQVALGPRPSLAIQSVSTGRIRTVPSDLVRLENPAWMPDGLAVIAEGTTSEGGQGLFRISLENGALTPIGDVTTALIGTRSHPVVSLDGRELLYTLNSKSIEARNLISGTVRVVFEGPAQTLALSPDGRFLAVGGSRHVQGQVPPVQIVSVAGSPVRGLAAEIETGFLDQGIAWSHDGRYVWFTQHSDSLPPGMPLWRVPVDGGPAQRMSPLSKGLASTINRLSAAPDGSMAVSISMGSTEQWVMRNIPIPAGR